MSKLIRVTISRVDNFAARNAELQFVPMTQSKHNGVNGIDGFVVGSVDASNRPEMTVRLRELSSQVPSKFLGA